MSTSRHPVLIVDDEPDILFSLRGLLRTEFDLMTATSGAEALDIMHRQPVHVIMTDQRMPHMSGTELLRQSQGECPEAIRIVFTGYADIKSVVDAINQGRIYRYLTKPWDPDELVGVLHEACAQYDLIIERKSFARDLEEHLKRCQALLSGQENGEMVQTAESCAALLARLGRLAFH